ncbi:hypothetical protein [Sphingobacterium arenae]|uniref:Cyclically-permuted mutarotase family protein n=1 Tax=Sphingobacterium arenae TaxID=1280598 RepID=A0ABR7XYZ7_9SPHI|nr:hypothetical protein [Sphingobacterium arenae]MBD1424290.1 hypothetical protein [Sphingobacterium arenae]
MKLTTSILLLTVVLSSCSSAEKSKTIVWNNQTKLPANADGSSHLGLAGPVAGMMGDKLLIAGGANFPGKMPWDGGAKQYATETYIYQLENGVLTFLTQSELKEAIAYPGNCSVGQILYVAGGENESGAVKSVKKFSLKGNTLQEESLPDLPLALTNGSLVFASNKLYFVGGENQQLVSDKIYRLDLSAENMVWEEAFTLAHPVSNAVVVSDKKNKLYIAGGRMRNTDSLSTIYNQLFEVDLPSGSINKITDLPQPTAAGTGIWDDDGHILLFGGDHAETFHRVEALIAQINQTTDASWRNTLIEEKAVLQRQHPGFSSHTWSFNVVQKKWKKQDDIIGESPVTTTALRHQNSVIIPSGEIRAGVRTDQILVGHMKNKEHDEK